MVLFSGSVQVRSALSVTVAGTERELCGGAGKSYLKRKSEREDSIVVGVEGFSRRIISQCTF